MQERDNTSPSQHRRNQLPPLAPRNTQESARERPPGSTATGRTPRLSHRSRAGCWTCRGRKVKCDEAHPRCGPCTRLNRDCDWDYRWNFSDATSSTQIKHSNVTTTGSAVWDPQARGDSPGLSPRPSRRDDLPAFSVLTNDEDRERKAGSRLPGTFSVVVTPESFADLPEYAATASTPLSRRTSVNSSRSQLSGPDSRLTRTASGRDPNIVVLGRFEDAAPGSAGPFSPQPFDRRGSLPDTMHRMSIAAPPLAPLVRTATYPIPSASGMSAAEARLVSHFRRHVVQRLVPSVSDGLLTHNLTPGSTRDVYEMESIRFPPLHHAICAISALNLSYRGQATLEEAIEHYDKALSAQTPASSPDELLSDGVFFRHYLLFVYDICMTVDSNATGAGMWAEHLNSLRRLAQHRFVRSGREPQSYTIWSICALDVHASLMGNGDCAFFRTMVGQNILPPFGAGMPEPGPTSFASVWPNEGQTLPAILSLARGVMILTAKLAQAAHTFRAEAHGRPMPVSPGSYARWQTTVSQLQTQLLSFWAETYPEFLERDSPLAARNLPPRVRTIFEFAFLQFQASILYLRTSMFPGQRLIPVANQANVNADSATRISHILAVASTILGAGDLERREAVFPIFIAGFAAMTGDAKIQAIDQLRAFEGSGIGQNTYVVRKLLVAVCEEQRRRLDLGGRMEEVDWLLYSRERGLSVVNCGL